MPDARSNTGVAKPTSGGALDVLPAALVQQFSEMATMVPDTESDGGASLLESILNAVSVEDLDKPFAEKDQDHLIGMDQVVESISKSGSDFADGLGVFLVVKAVVEDTAETITWTTGSMSVVAQLVRAYALDAFPLRCKLRRSDKPTKSGFYPLNLVISDNQPR